MYTPSSDVYSIGVLLLRLLVVLREGESGGAEGEATRYEQSSILLSIPTLYVCISVYNSMLSYTLCVYVYV